MHSGGREGGQRGHLEQLPHPRDSARQPKGEGWKVNRKRVERLWRLDAVTPARVLGRQLVHALDQPQLEVRRNRLVPLRRPVLPQESASPTLRHAVTTAEVADGLSAARRAQNFPRATSLSMEMSSACSATIRFRREFSCSSAFSRWASSSFRAPYLSRQR